MYKEKVWRSIYRRRGKIHVFFVRGGGEWRAMLLRIERRRNSVAGLRDITRYSRRYISAHQAVIN